MVCLSRPFPFKFFKGCLPQNLLSPLLSTLSHIQLLQELRKLGNILFQLFKSVLYLYRDIKLLHDQPSQYVEVVSTTALKYF